MSVHKCLEELPRTIKVGAYDWTVLVEAGEHENCGQTLFDTATIRLWPINLTSPAHVVGIVIHECLHVIYDNEKLGKLKKDREEREEQIVQGFESGLVSLLRDNPRLTTWIKKWLGK